MSSARWPHDQVGLSYREKAGSRQPPTFSDGDHVRPASSTPRQELPSLFCPISGILTLEPPCTQTNGEGAADPGRGLTADGDESLLHLSFCSVPQHSAPLPTHHPCMSALPFLPVYFGGWSTAPDPPSSDPLLPTPEHLEASHCLQGFSQPPPNSLFSPASHRPKGVGSEGTEAVLAFAQPPYCPPICATVLAQ